MAMRIEIDARGNEKAQKKLEAIGFNSADVRPVWESVQQAMLENEKTLFARSGGGGKANWGSNSPETVAAKGSSEPMVDSGRLKRAMTSKQASGSIRELWPDAMRFGARVLDPETNKPYGMFHQGRVRTPDRGFPRRRFLRMLPKNKKNIQASIIDYLIGDDA